MSQFRVYSDTSPEFSVVKAIKAANEALSEHGIKIHMISMNDGGDDYEDYEIVAEVMAEKNT